MTKYRITVHFGPYRFSADCGSVAVAFHHIEALILSTMDPGTQEKTEEACGEYLLMLADLADRREERCGNGLFQVEAIREGRRKI